jgi:MFS family permease
LNWIENLEIFKFSNTGHDSRSMYGSTFQPRPVSSIPFPNSYLIILLNINCYFFQALIGIAYSIGFIVGPTIGAVFASQSSIKGGNFYYLPAVFAAVLSFVDILFVVVFFKETLPQEKRVNKLK